MSGFSLSRAVERFVVPWTRLEWPLPLRAIFDRDAPTGIELGFGNGEFLQDLALARPETNWIGVEISWVSIQRLLRRLDRRGIANVRVAQGDGGFLLERGFAPATLTDIYINHPDPWPKKRHHSRRLVQPQLVAAAATKLVRGGRCTMVTDHDDYAEWIAGVLEAQTALVSTVETTRADTVADRFETKYEKKGRAAGSRIHYFVWERTGGESAPAPPREEVGDMPNVLLEGPVSGPELVPHFSSQDFTESHRDVPVHIRLESVYAGRSAREWLIEARTQEGGFGQHFAIQVTIRTGGQVLIKPSSIGYPRPTWAVKEAVRRVAALIVQAHPELSIRSSGVGEVTTR